MRAANDPALAAVGARLADAIADMEAAAAWLGTTRNEGRVADALAGATPFLRLCGLTAGAVALARSALLSAQDTAIAASPAGARRALVARFFAANPLTATASLRREIEAGGDVIASATSEMLTS